MRITLTALALMAAMSTGAADWYKWTDESGQTHIGNVRPHGQEAEILQYDDTRPPPAEFKPSPRYTSRPVQQGSGDAHYLRAPTPNASLDECKRVKREAVIAEQRRSSARIDQLDSWLWKNCRAYSNELRKISQQMM